MKTTFLAIAAVFILCLKSNGQDCNCTINLNDLMESIEHDYVGFEHKVNKQTIKEYYALKEELVQKSGYIRNGYGCFELLKKYTSYFKDPHLNISIGMLEPSDELKKEIASVFRSLPKIDVSEASVKKYLVKQTKNGIEGIWQNPNFKYKIAIIKDSVTPGVYKGYTLGEDSLYWFNGQVKLDIRSVQQKLVVTYYRNDHWPDVKPVKFLNGNMLIEGYSSWTMDYPEKATPLQAKKVIDFKIVSDSVCFIALTSLDISNKSAIDSVISNNMNTLLKSKYLIIDLRNNSGGSIMSCDLLMPLLYTNPIISDGFIVKSSKTNIKGYEHYAANSDFDTSVQSAFGEIASKMKKHGDGLVLISGADTTIWADSISTNPRQVAILVNNASVSAAELFVLRAKQSKKVTLFGSRTRGALDYTEAETRSLSCPYFIYSCPIGMSDHTITPYIDNIGIKPDVTIDDSNPDWTAFVMKYYEKEERKVQ